MSLSSYWAIRGAKAIERDITHEVEDKAGTWA